MVVSLTDEWLAAAGLLTGIAPGQAELRGAHVSINRPDARQVCARLIEAGVLRRFPHPAARSASGCRRCRASFTEVWDAVDTIRALTVR